MGGCTRCVLWLLLASGCATPHLSTLAQPRPVPPLVTDRHFAGGDALLAKRAFDRGDYKRARALLAREAPSFEVRLLRALSAYKAKDHAVAGPELLALGAEYAALADRCFLWAGASFEATASLGDAAVAYASVSAGTTSFPAARLALAKVYARTHALEMGAAALQPLLEGERTPARAEALWLLATFQRARGEAGLERESLLRLWAEHPTSAFAAKAAARLPRGSFTAEVSLRRAESLLALRQPREALAGTRAVLAAGPLSAALACRAKGLNAHAHLRLRRAVLAQKELLEVVKGCEPSETRAEALWTLARDREGRAALALYDRLAGEQPTHPLADDALLAAGVLSLQLGDTPGALERLDRVGARYPTGDAAAEALFAAFWWHRRSGNRDAALAALERLDGAAPGLAGDTHPKVLYWRARLLEETGDAAQAEPLYDAVARAAPGTYYGLLALQRRARGQEEVGAESPEQAAALESLYADPHFNAGLALHRLGLPDALRELARVELENKPAEARTLLLRVLYDAGRKRQVELLSSQGELAGAVTPETAPVWRLAFPDTFRPLVERSATQSQVDPNLLHAVIREESRFRPSVRSSAGALGLAQLMPSTARYVGRQAGLTVTERGLLVPHKNLRLASLYLRSLLDTFEGNLVYVTASYNAGPNAVQRWLRERPGLEVDDWVEEIPFLETRQYVKRVLSSYAAYALLTASPPTLMAPKAQLSLLTRGE